MHDQIDFSIDGLSSGLQHMSSRWRSRAVTSITATICTSTFCCKRAVADGIMPVNPVSATVYTHCRSKRLTVQWERFRSLFERAPDGSDFIIYSAVGGVLDPDHLSAYWRDVLDGLKLPHVRFHDIRHTFATRAIEQCLDAATVAGLLGHADVTTTTHYYVHPREASMHRAMAAIEPVGKIGHAWQNTRLFAPARTEEKIPKAAQRIHRWRKHIAECV